MMNYDFVQFLRSYELHCIQNAVLICGDVEKCSGYEKFHFALLHCALAMLLKLF